MRKLIWLLLIPQVLVGSPSNLDLPKKGEEPHVIVARTVLLRLNKLSLEKNYAPLEPDINSVNLIGGEEHGAYRESNFYRVCTPSHIYIDFLLGSDDSLLSIIRDFFNRGAQQFDSPPKPTWSLEKAIHEGRDWATAFLGQFPKNVGQPRVKFIQEQEYPKFYEGKWEVRWPRCDSEGHEFYHDALYVEINEKRGLISSKLDFFSSFNEVKGTLISEAEAISTSSKPAERLRDEASPSYLPLGLQLRPLTASLIIVNPNHILGDGRDIKSLNVDTPARLAWVVFYQLLEGPDSKPSHSIQVWIDAFTDEPIGGAIR